MKQEIDKKVVALVVAGAIVTLAAIGFLVMNRPGQIPPSEVVSSQDYLNSQAARGQQGDSAKPAVGSSEAESRSRLGGEQRDTSGLGNR